MAKELVRMEIEPASNCGHTVTHHYRAVRHKDPRSHSGITEYVEPESHVFGDEEGHKLIRHIADHLGITAPKGKEEDKEEDDEDTVSED